MTSQQRPWDSSPNSLCYLAFTFVASPGPHGLVVTISLITGHWGGTMALPFRPVVNTSQPASQRLARRHILGRHHATSGRHVLLGTAGDDGGGEGEVRNGCGQVA